MTETLTAELPSELIARIGALAAECDLPRDRMVEQLLESHFEIVDSPERHAKMLIGLADIDAGRVVSHEAVVAWVESLATDHPLPRPQPGQ